MLPSELTAGSFAGYPPEAQRLAIQQLALLRRLPLAFLPLLLRELIVYDWKFPLERADLARKRGATLHGMLRGYATLADGYHPSSPEPSGKWEQRVMELAIQNADLPGGADQIGAVVAHGTGTPVGDIAELAALNRIYGHRDVAMPVTSPKGNFGHPHGPAGALGLLVGLLGMKQNAVMATAGTYDTKDLMPEVGKLHVVINEPAPAQVDAIQVNAFGFGGQNSSIVVSRK